METQKHGDLDEYRRALKDRVCSICRKTGYGDVCTIGKGGICPIETHLPRLVDAVLSTPRSREISDYLPKVQEMVCGHCINEDERGVCTTRDLAQCGLNSFLLLVVETIEEVYDRRHSS